MPKNQQKYQVIDKWIALIFDFNKSENVTDTHCLIELPSKIFPYVTICTTAKPEVRDDRM